MKATRFKPTAKDLLEFDFWTFCQSGGAIQSSEVNVEFPRLGQESGQSDSPYQRIESLEWSVEGRLNARREAELSIRGELKAHCACVVCGEGVAENLQILRKLRVLKSESLIERYDEALLDDETDLVCADGLINLRDWLEDEVLLSAPMFSRHADCGIGGYQAQIGGHDSDGTADSEINDEENLSSPTDLNEQPVGETRKAFAGLDQMIRAGKKKS